MSSKSADHSSIQLPAYEHIKAQLERQKKQQKVPQPQPPQPDHSESEKRNHDIRVQGNRILYKGPTDEEKAAAVAEQMRRKRQDGGAAEKEKLRRGKEHEDAEMGWEVLEKILDNMDSEMGLDDANDAVGAAVQDWPGNSNGGYEE